MNNESITPQAINAWRDYVLKHIVDNLEANKDNILEQFECEDAHRLTRQEIEHIKLESTQSTSVAVQYHQENARLMEDNLQLKRHNESRDLQFAQLESMFFAMESCRNHTAVLTGRRLYITNQLMCSPNLLRK